MDTGDRAGLGQTRAGRQPQLAAEIAVFRAAHNVVAEDTTLLGPPQYAVRARTIQKLLENRAQAVVRTQSPHARRFEQLIDSIDPRIRADGYWPQLAAHLAQAATSRPDLPGLVRAAAIQRPLPDELPAAALWWRLAAELTPAATVDTPTPACALPGSLTCTTSLGQQPRNPSSPIPPGPASSQLSMPPTPPAGPPPTFFTSPPSTWPTSTPTTPSPPTNTPAPSPTPST